MRPGLRRAWALGWVVAMGTGCGLLFQESRPPASPVGAAGPGGGAAGGEAPSPTVEGEGAPGALIPAGYGTLRQEELAIRLRRGELEMYVVPLDEMVIRTAAPDTWERLSALGSAHRSWFRERTGSDAPYRIFLVALYTEAEPLAFEPGELAVVTGGIRLRPVLFRGLTPGWDQQRVVPDEAQMAVYAFPPEVSLDGDLELEYQEVRSRDWARVLPVIQAEQQRVRARSPGR
jgi:hypothetical protein